MPLQTQRSIAGCSWTSGAMSTRGVTARPEALAAIARHKMSLSTIFELNARKLIVNWAYA